RPEVEGHPSGQSLHCVRALGIGNIRQQHQPFAVIGLAVLNFRFQGIVGLGGKSPVQLDTEENRCGPE
ncbi:hypothetical protein ID854_13930, partial [Xenorhabdus sp. M]|nr:hypothetical protein [Xenorhabdus sp. M]